MVGGESDLEQGMNRGCPQEFLSEDSAARGEGCSPLTREVSIVHLVSELRLSLLVPENPLYMATQPGGHSHTARRAHTATQPGGHSHTARRIK